MFTEQRRAITICCVAVVINLVFSALARWFNLPLWLDTTGTVYASMILGFPYGFVVGLVNNVFWTIVTNGHNSFAFYLVSMAVAFVSAKASPVPARMTQRAFFKLLVLLFLVSTFFASAMTFFVSAGIPADYWGRNLMSFLMEHNVAPVLASVLSVAGIKLLDTVITLIVVTIALRLTPLKYRDSGYVIRRSPI